MSEPRLFHLAEARAWRAFARSEEPVWRPASLVSEGFVHLSLAEQLAGTLATHFPSPGAGASLVLLEVERAAVAAALRMEVSRGGAAFPHVHAALPRQAFAGTWSLAGADGVWQLPRLAATRAGDVPRAEPPFAAPQGAP